MKQGTSKPESNLVRLLVEIIPWKNVPDNRGGDFEQDLWFRPVSPNLSSNKQTFPMCKNIYIFREILFDNPWFKRFQDLRIIVFDLLTGLSNIVEYNVEYLEDL